MSRRLLPLLAVGLLSGACGCTFHTGPAVRTVWADCNTLGKPALFVEQIDALPAGRAEVEYYRWTYNQGPGGGPLLRDGCLSPVVFVPAVPDGGETQALHPGRPETESESVSLADWRHARVPAPAVVPPDVRPPRGSWLFRSGQ